LYSNIVLIDVEVCGMQRPADSTFLSNIRTNPANCTASRARKPWSSYSHRYENLKSYLK